jgi:hypothetical protein
MSRRVISLRIEPRWLTLLIQRLDSTPRRTSRPATLYARRTRFDCTQDKIYRKEAATLGDGVKNRCQLPTVADKFRVRIVS